MGTKHDVLTEEEISSYKLNPRVIEQLGAFCRSFPDKKEEEINVLDWGCGRGRSVAKLRERGFNAYGVDIDVKVMSNGYPLFEKRGFSPRKLMRFVDEVNSFDDGFFHLIFSEQVLEHVEDLPGAIKEITRLTCPGGMGIHFFPGARNVWEEHLCMPFVHWLPKTILRKYWIRLMLLLGYGPRIAWAGTRDKSDWAAADVYFHYLNKKHIIGTARKSAMSLKSTALSPSTK